VKRTEPTSIDRFIKRFDEVKDLEEMGRLQTLQMHSALGALVAGNQNVALHYLHRAAEGASCTQIRHAMVELANIINERIS